MFNYTEFTTRNIGMISEAEQTKLKNSSVFIAGVGGMGGAALLNLVRAGLGSVWIADFDRFEVSNLNRQVFANLGTIGQEKIDATMAQLLQINPELKIKYFDQSWNDELPEILPNVDVVINGCDDTKASIQLMRAAREFKKIVIDAYPSPLPNVYVVRPEDPRPEERLKYPTCSVASNAFTDAQIKRCAELELQFVLTRSSSLSHVERGPVIEFFKGTRKRFSFAPMVITTGSLMAFECLRVLLNRTPQKLNAGYFFNPWTLQIERNPHIFSVFWRSIQAYRFLKSFT